MLKENSKIHFNKISKSEFSLIKDEIRFDGNLSQKNFKLVNLHAKIHGKLPHLCDRCGSEIELILNEKLDLLLSNGIYKDELNESLDIIEFFDGYIDLNQVLQSELEAYKSDYHYCDKCKTYKGE